MTATLVESRFWRNLNRADFKQIETKFSKEASRVADKPIKAKFQVEAKVERPALPQTLWDAIFGAGTEMVSKTIDKTASELTKDEIAKGVKVIGADSEGNIAAIGSTVKKKARLTVYDPAQKSVSVPKNPERSSSQNHQLSPVPFSNTSNRGHTNRSASSSATGVDRPHSVVFNSARGINDNKPSAPVQPSSAPSLSKMFSWAQNKAYAAVETATSLATEVASVVPSIFTGRSEPALATTTGVSHNNGAIIHQPFAQPEGSFRERLQDAIPFTSGTDNVIEPEFNFKAWMFGTAESGGSFNQGVMGTESVAPGFGHNRSTRFTSAEEYAAAVTLYGRETTGTAWQDSVQPQHEKPELLGV